MCASEDTITSLGSTFHLAAVFLKIGIINNAIKNVDTTFTATVLSNPPSASAYVPIATPAFSTTTSTRSSSLSARRQNSLTLSKLARSTGQTSTTPGRDVEVSISAFADCPLSTSRHARITLRAPRRQKWRAASFPRPTLAPVIIAVLSAKLVSG